MRVLGLLLSHNAESRISGALNSLGECCDAIYALDDRSVDRTREILQSHPLVKNVFSSEASLPSDAWYFSESMCLTLLYRMADFYQPDWIVMLSDDDTLTNGARLRAVMDNADPTVAGIEIERFSTWDDPHYPLMVPLMSRARAWDCRMWRHLPGLLPGLRWLHNGYHPPTLQHHGDILRTKESTLLHHGWNTLDARVDKVKQYRALDPLSLYNHGMPYDRGLLFGYALEQLDDLIAEYRRRFALDESRARANG